MPNFTKTLNLEKPLRGEFYAIEKHNENSDKIDLAIEKITVPTIEHLKNMIELQEGDIVDLQGYYTAGDGAHHKRKIESADDGSGVQLANGLWANIVHNGEVDVSWFGAKGDGVTDDTVAIQNSVNLGANNVRFGNGIFLIKKTVVIKEQVSLIGMGKYQTIIKSNFDNYTLDSNIFEISVEKDIRDTSVSGFYFLPNANTHVCLLIKIKNKNLAYAKNKITNNKFETNTGTNPSWSIQVSTDENDGFFCNEITENEIANGLSISRIGDSNVIENNLIYGKQKVYFKTVVGSNSNVYSKNNTTCEGGVEIIGGGNWCVFNNNFEAFRENTNKDYYLKFSGESGMPESQIGLSFYNNNFVHSTGVQGVKGILLTDSIFVNIKNNYLATNYATENYKHVSIVGTCRNVNIIDNNMSSIENEILVDGECSNLTIRNKGTREVIKDNTVNKIIENPTTTDYVNKAINTLFRFSDCDTINKYVLATMKNGVQKNLVSLGNNRIEFERGAFAMPNSDGAKFNIVLRADGVVCSENVANSLLGLDTPYHASNMQKLGILDSYHQYLTDLHEYEKQQNTQSNTNVMNLNAIQPLIIPTEVEEYAKEYNLI